MRTKLQPGDLVYAGAGTTLVIAYLGLVPGVIPALALLVLVGAVLVAPLLAIGLAAALIASPPYALWRLASSSRRHNEPKPRVRQAAPPPVVAPRAS